jgi:Domain of unknown function (DUF397)
MADPRLLLDHALTCRRSVPSGVLAEGHRTTKADLMRLFTLLSNRHSASDSSGTWLKSSLSGYNGNCVEVAGLTGDTIRVRDSKHPRGAVLNFTPAEWATFIGGVHNGEFDRKPSSQ